MMILPPIRATVLADMLAWINDAPGSSADGHPGPGWDADGYEPTDLEAAEQLGHELGLAGEPAPACDDATPERAHLARLRGHAHGAWWRAELAHRDAAEWRAWLDSLPGPDPDWESMYPGFDPHHPAERIEARGCIRARQ